MVSSPLKRNIPTNGIEERLQNVETELSFHKAVPRDIYRRLKAIEDRLLHLESISPEYSNFWVRKHYFLATPTNGIASNIVCFSFRIKQLFPPDNLQKNGSIQCKMLTT